MTTILNLIMTDNKIKYEYLARQVKQIVIDYTEGQPHNQNFGMNPEIWVSTEKIYMLIPKKMKLSFILFNAIKMLMSRYGLIIKRPPYVCSLLKKFLNIDKVNEMKYKGGKKYSFDILKLEQIYVLLKDKQLVLPEKKTLPSVKNLKGKSFCKFHQAISHSTNNFVCFRDLIQEEIMERRLKFDEGKKDMKVDIDPFDSTANFVEP
ncbi:hypothetical protein Ahy_A07g032060 [Arachis hypogaea]|uniref:Uncharacterized protein n=1 Tax=Arachis hypogaea TaxID=3818 RepID=A0A445C5Y4_ARAHY|nr:hypothetical protein Ahy_A07g032060 [Arachis hypogaea]